MVYEEKTRVNVTLETFGLLGRLEIMAQRRKKKTTKKAAKKTAGTGTGRKQSAELRSLDAMIEMSKGASAGSMAVKALRSLKLSPSDLKAMKAIQATYAKVVKDIASLSDGQQKAILFAAGSDYDFDSLIRKASKSPQATLTINERAERAAVDILGVDAPAMEFICFASRKPLGL